MFCGHCGTAIKPGYKTCSACGAMYLQQSGCIGRLFGLVGVLLLVAGGIIVFPVLNGPKDQTLALVDMSLIAGGGVILLIVKRTAPINGFEGCNAPCL